MEWDLPNGYYNFYYNFYIFQLPARANIAKVCLCGLCGPKTCVQSFNTALWPLDMKSRLSWLVTWWGAWHLLPWLRPGPQPHLPVSHQTWGGGHGGPSGETHRDDLHWQGPQAWPRSVPEVWPYRVVGGERQAGRLPLLRQVRLRALRISGGQKQGKNLQLKLFRQHHRAVNYFLFD